MAEHIQSKIEEVKIESDNHALIAEVTHGVAEEGLNSTSIIKWSILGVVVVAGFIVILMFFAQFALQNAQDNVNVTSSYREITKLKEDANAVLNSYGVIDLEAGIYRIPIDEAINKIATD